jgi:hypothetical protein
VTCTMTTHYRDNWTRDLTARLSLLQLELRQDLALIGGGGGERWPLHRRQALCGLTQPFPPLGFDLWFGPGCV